MDKQDHEIIASQREMDFSQYDTLNQVRLRQQRQESDKLRLRKPSSTFVPFMDAGIQIGDFAPQTILFGYRPRNRTSAWRTSFRKPGAPT